MKLVPSSHTIPYPLWVQTQRHSPSCASLPILLVSKVSLATHSAKIPSESGLQ